MLVRMLVENDIHAWLEIADEVSEMFDSPDMAADTEFQDFIKRRVSKFEAIGAFDRMTKELLGVIAISKKSNSISWFAVKEKYRGCGIGTQLLTSGMRQLDNRKDISVITFNDKKRIKNREIYENHGFEVKNENIYHMGHRRCLMIKPAGKCSNGKSFHYDYEKYVRESLVENCGPCSKSFMVLPNNERLAELEYSYIDISREAQACLFGKCNMIPKYHVVDFEDMPIDVMKGFMCEMQILGKALKEVTGAVKINYEMHSNSMAHLHVHVFPRYLNDKFPSLPIDFRIKEPSPYKDEEEFMWFVNEMRIKIKKLSSG